jgi:predicted ATPase
MKNRNVMQALCEELTSEFRIICFDEFQVLFTVTHSDTYCTAALICMC